MDEQTPGTYKAGFITFIGRPNVGKSTLVNRLLGQKIAAVSPKPQTTRRRQLGILSLKEPPAQIIFMDTPGIHNPQHHLGNYMNEVALDTLTDADVIVWIVDANSHLLREDHLCVQYLSALTKHPPVILALNKIDMISSPDLITRRQAACVELYTPDIVCPISAATGLGIPELLNEMLARLPEGAPFYDEEQITDLYEREIAADLIREATLLFLKDEVPHSIAVRVDEYKDRDAKTAYIAATLFVERESQKGIVIGKGGEMLKKIGMTARKEIEEMNGRKVFLELKVKVSKDWRNNPDSMKHVGYFRKAEG